MPGPIILALDQSPTVTGWAVGDGTTPPVWGLMHHPNFGDNEAALMCAVYDQTVNLGKPYGAEYLFTEQLLLGTNSSNENVKLFIKKSAVMLSMHFAAKRALQAEPYEAPIGTWREYFLGTASAPKGCSDRTSWLKDCAMQECAAANMLPATHHEAEAIGIWHYAQHLLNPRFRQTDGPRRRRAAQKRDDERHAGLVVRKKRKTPEPADG